MILLVDPLHTNHRSICADPGALRRLCKRTAFGTKIIHIKIISFPAIVAFDSAHLTASFVFIITQQPVGHKQLSVAIRLFNAATFCLRSRRIKHT